MKSNKIIGITLGVLLILFFGGMLLMKYKPDTLERFNINTSDLISTTTDNGTTTNQVTEKTSTDLKTNIVAPSPVNGTRKAIIELGSTGFNRFVIVSDKQKRYQVEDKTFGESYAKEGLTNKDEVMSKLRTYISETLNKFNIDKSNVHFVVSSGATKEPLILQIAQELKKNYFVNIATPQQEATWVLNSMVLDEYRDKAVYVDVGGGNTKIAWYQNGKVQTRESHGAKFTQDNTKETDVIVSISNIMKEIPSANKEYIFIIGGVPNKLASVENVGERYQYLRNDYNIDQLFKDNKDYQRIKNGWLILKTIIDGSNDAKLIYDYDANFSLGYLVTL